MSYDIHIADEDFNYTYNVSGMWYASQPDKGIRTIYGMNGREAAKVINEMMNYMVDHWIEMLAMNPSNGWGSAEGAYDFLARLSAASMRNVDAVWEGD